jgi:hypothetical protein
MEENTGIFEGLKRVCAHVFALCLDRHKHSPHDLAPEKDHGFIPA